MVMVATSVSSNVGFAFGVLGPQLRTDLGVSRTALGVLASAFFAATGAASMAAGRLVRRIGPRRGAAYALGIESVVCVVAGLAGRYLPLLAAGLLAGVAYAVVNVASNRVVRSLADDAHLGRYMTVKTAGVPVATTTIAVVSGLTTRWGWQPVVVGIGVCAGAAAVAAARILGQFESPTGAAVPLPVQPRPAGPDRLGAGFFLLPLAGFCFIAGSQPLYNWVPSYLHESLGLTVGRASLATGLATAIGIPAMIGIARLADRVGGSYRALFLGGLCAITATATVLVLSCAHRRCGCRDRRPGGRCVGQPRPGRAVPGPDRRARAARARTRHGSRHDRILLRRARVTGRVRCAGRPVRRLHRAVARVPGPARDRVRPLRGHPGGPPRRGRRRAGQLTSVGCVNRTGKVAKCGRPDATSGVGARSGSGSAPCRSRVLTMTTIVPNRWVRPSIPSA